MKLLGAALMLVGLACAGGDVIGSNSSSQGSIPRFQTGATTARLAGIGIYFTPKSSGEVIIWMSGTLSCNAATRIYYSVVYGTGDLSNPSTALDRPGIVGTSPRWAPTYPNAPFGFSRCLVASGLTVGTRYWVDLALSVMGNVPDSSVGVLDGVDIIVQEATNN